MSLNKAQFEKFMRVIWELSPQLTTYDILIQALDHLGLEKCWNFEIQDPRFQMRLKWLEETLLRCKEKGFDLNQTNPMGFTVFSGWAMSGKTQTLQKIEVFKMLYRHGASSLCPLPLSGLKCWESLQKNPFADPVLVKFLKDLSEEEEVRQLQERLQGALPDHNASSVKNKKHL